MLYECSTYEFQDSEDREIEVWSVLDERLLGREIRPEGLARCVVELRHAGKSRIVRHVGGRVEVLSTQKRGTKVGKHTQGANLGVSNWKVDPAMVEDFSVARLQILEGPYQVCPHRSLHSDLFLCPCSLQELE